MIPPLHLPPDLAKLWSALNAATLPVPRTLAGQPIFSAEPQAPIEWRPTPSAARQNEPLSVLLNHVAAAVTRQQSLESLLGRAQHLLQRMLAISQSAKSADLAPEARTALTREFVTLQLALGKIGSQLLADPSAPAPRPQEIPFPHVIPAFSLAPLPEILEKLHAEALRRKSGSKPRRRVRLPTIAIITCIPRGGTVDAGSNLAALLSQNYPHLELLVWDGSERDDTRKQLESWGEPVRRLEPRHSDFARLFAEGAAQSSGEIVGWLEPGDQLFPHSLLWVASLFSKHPSIGWICGAAAWIQPQGLAVACENANAKKIPFRRLTHSMFPPGTFWRRALWERLAEMLSPLESGEWWIWERLLELAQPSRVKLVLGGSPPSGVSADSAGSAIKNQGDRLNKSSEFQNRGAELFGPEIVPIEPQCPLAQLLQEIESAAAENRWDEAANFANRAVAAEPADADLYRLQAACDYHAGHVARAQSILWNLSILFP